MGDGTGASGTWEISISGNAATATTATNLAFAPVLAAGTTNTNAITVTAGGKTSDEFIVPYSTSANGAQKLLYQSMLGYRNDFDNFTNVAGLRVALFQNKGTEADGTNLVNLPFGDGSLLSFPWGGDNRYGAQLAVEDAGSTNHLAIRCRTGAANTWGAWAMVLTSANYNLYSPKLDGTGASGTWDINITGNATTATTADKLVVSSSSDVTKTLKVDEWTNMVAINSLTAGTYAVQIYSGNLYASGVFSACGGTDILIDEIPLHVSNSTSGETWRPYARVNGNNLQMATNETTGTSRQYTINIVKLI